MKYHMDYTMEHPEETSKVAGLQKKVDEVKGVMVDNIERVCPSYTSISVRVQSEKWNYIGKELLGIPVALVSSTTSCVLTSCWSSVSRAQMETSGIFDQV